MHNTHPKKCEHKLVHCEQCDIVYCEVCKEEWNKPVSSWHTITPPYTGGTYPVGMDCRERLGWGQI